MSFLNFFEKPKNERASDLEQKTVSGNNYFDENESREGGSHVDESTGENYDNETDMDSESPEMQTISHVSEDKKYERLKEDLDDEGAKLLREQFKDNPEALKELGLD